MHETLNKTDWISLRVAKIFTKGVQTGSGELINVKPGSFELEEEEILKKN